MIVNSSRFLSLFTVAIRFSSRSTITEIDSVPLGQVLEAAGRNGSIHFHLVGRIVDGGCIIVIQRDGQVLNDLTVTGSIGHSPQICAIRDRGLVLHTHYGHSVIIDRPTQLVDSAPNVLVDGLHNIQRRVRHILDTDSASGNGSEDHYQGQYQCQHT